MEKVRSRNYEQGMYSFFEPQLNVRSKEVWNGGSFLIRLQPDVSEQRFLHDFRTWAYSNLKAGNLYIREVSTYKEQLDYLEYGSGVTNKYRMNIILAVFFLINLALGVTGAFWLQTRSRREEVGIMLSYGAALQYMQAINGRSCYIGFVCLVGGVSDLFAVWTGRRQLV